MIGRRTNLALSAPSFLRLGLPWPEADWGGMLSNSYVGDAVRDAFDVRLQRP